VAPRAISTDFRRITSSPRLFKPDLAAALPDEIYDRIDRYLEAWLSEPAGAPMSCDPQ
jgi:hypothetical protein